MAEGDEEIHEESSSHGAPGSAERAKEAKGKGGFFAKHKVEIIATALGIAVTIYLYIRSKGSSTSSAAASPTDATTPSSTDGGGGGWGGGSGGGSTGGTTGDTGTGHDHSGNGDSGDSALATALEDLTNEMSQMGTSAQVNGGVAGDSSTGNSAANIGSNLSDDQAKQAVAAGASPVAALNAETPAASETDAQRHQQEVNNRSLRAAAGLGDGTPKTPAKKK